MSPSITTTDDRIALISNVVSMAVAYAVFLVNQHLKLSSRFQMDMWMFASYPVQVGGTDESEELFMHNVYLDWVTVHR